MRTIRASEIGSFLYCSRAWWYRLQGIQSENTTELEAGSEYHYRHGAQVLTGRLLRVLGWLALLAAIALLAAGLTGLLIHSP